MVFNFADDSRNLVFRKGSSSIDFKQGYYGLTFFGVYNNKYLKNEQDPTNREFYIRLTKVDDNDNYVSFSWDRDNIDGLGTPLPNDILNEDVEGYYQLVVKGWSVSNQYSLPLLTKLAKVVNDWSIASTLYDINTGTGDEETGAEYVYYRE